MKQRAMITAVLGSLLALGAMSMPIQVVGTTGKEKCYGVAKAGRNDCASPGSAHACAGQPKTNKDPMPWKYMPAGTCTQTGSTTQPVSK